LPTKLPLVGGHEGAGVVVAVGDLVKDVEIGEHAGVKVCLTYLTASCTAMTKVSSGLMEPVYHVPSVNNRMSHCAQKPFLVATLSTELSNSIVSPRQRTLLAFRRSAISRPLHQSCVRVSQFTRASRSLRHVLGRLLRLLVQEEVSVVWLASMQRPWVCM
jgi:hypothetical protein